MRDDDNDDDGDADDDDDYAAAAAADSVVGALYRDISQLGHGVQAWQRPRLT